MKGKSFVEKECSRREWKGRIGFRQDFSEEMMFWLRPKGNNRQHLLNFFLDGKHCAKSFTCII